MYSMENDKDIDITIQGVPLQTPENTEIPGLLETTSKPPLKTWKKLHPYQKADIHIKSLQFLN